MFLYCLVHKKRCKAAAPTGDFFVWLGSRGRRPMAPNLITPHNTGEARSNSYQGLQLATWRLNGRTCELRPSMISSRSTMSSKRKSTLRSRPPMRENYWAWRCCCWTRYSEGDARGQNNPFKRQGVCAVPPVLRLQRQRYAYLTVSRSVGVFC